ncbi:putative pectate lyase 11 [Phtheirospermum japonicum]|uniref:Putative pectate lyase 11 n=1 Tax=Phtheirospermum japonicum TaxID=374723 RepID=A0A830D169_9LAMI|nr:putative pectate lyase 11 [Phtheirospermum japonicum]
MFEGGRGYDVDVIQIKPNSIHIWIDRCSLSDYDHGLIDITRGSMNITISRCHFANHDKRCSSGPTLRTRVIDASALLFAIISSTGPDRDIRMSDTENYVCIITLGIGEFIPFTESQTCRYIHSATFMKLDKRRWQLNIYVSIR